MKEITPALLPKNVTVHRARNPSPMTAQGTNCFVFHGDTSYILDPGPADRGFFQEIKDALKSPVGGILISHAHVDHSSGAAAASKFFDAPILALGDAQFGRATWLAPLEPHLPRGQGIDHGFGYDQQLYDGEIIETSEHRLEILHTPGHMGNHFCVKLDDEIFVGDHILEWSTTMIAPYEGDLERFLLSCDRLLELAPSRLWPAHGAQIEAPNNRIQEIMHHRQERTAQILENIGPDMTPITALLTKIYPDIPKALHPAAQASLLAHLLSLWNKKHIDFPLIMDGKFDVQLNT